MDMERKYDRKLRQLGDELLELRIDILRYQAQINESWVSDEA